MSEMIESPLCAIALTCRINQGEIPGMASLQESFLESDRFGNVNVSKFGPKLAGAGGFINISQNSKKVVFVGCFTAGKFECETGDGKLRITKETGMKKFVNSVEHVTFSGDYARKKCMKVLYITERCVFTLCEEGLELIEIAPGMELERDIFPFMEFKPVIKRKPKIMDGRIFRREMMGLKEDLLTLPISERVSYDKDQDLFFVNFERLDVRSTEQIEEIRVSVKNILAPLKKKVYAIVNYDGFTIAPELMDAYSEMVDDVVRKYYRGVTRYTTSAFLRMKLGEALSKRNLAPYIFESEEVARRELHKACS